MVFSNWVPDEHGVESGNFINSHPENIKFQVNLNQDSNKKYTINGFPCMPNICEAGSRLEIRRRGEY